VKEIERAGIPTVIVCALTGIAENVGASRCQQAAAIPHPLGDPALTLEQEKALRLKLTLEALNRLLA